LKNAFANTLSARPIADRGGRRSRTNAVFADTLLTLPGLRANQLRYPALIARYCTRRERRQGFARKFEGWVGDSLSGLRALLSREVFFLTFFFHRMPGCSDRKSVDFSNSISSQASRPSKSRKQPK